MQVENVVDSHSQVMDMISVSLRDAYENVEIIIDAGNVPFLVSNPGLGKSSLARKVAKEYNLKFIDIRLAYYDPVAINGFPTVDDGKSKFIPMEQFPVKGDELPKDYDKKGNVVHKYDGWLINFDELTNATRAVQGAAYGILLDRMVGQHELHESVAMMACGNPVSANAAAHSMSTALQSRICHLHIKSHLQNWIEDYAIPFNVDPRIIAYLRHKPEQLNTFQPNHTDFTYCCERTWGDLLSPMIEDIPELTQKHLPLVASAIGATYCSEFIATCDYFNSAPSIDAIIEFPVATELPTQPAIMLMLANLLAREYKTSTDKKEKQNIVTYIKRLQPEFGSVFCKDVLVKNLKAMSDPILRPVFAQHAHELME